VLRDRIGYLIARHKCQRIVTENIFCPACKSRLRLLGQAKSYETLSEHVSDPNGHHPLKPAFVCLNEQCKLNLTTGCFFGMEGDCYKGNGFKDPLPDKWWYAIGSISYHVDKKVEKH